jgi:hypothetical protein
MKGCRLFDYAFVANTPTPTVLEEMHYLNRLPDCIPILEALRIELPQYQTIAQEEVQKPEISRKGKWKFWVANMLTLPNWFLGVEFVALIQPSSGCSERVFAMATSSFDETQTSTLEDGREATVMVKSAVLGF